MSQAIFETPIEWDREEKKDSKAEGKAAQREKLTRIAELILMADVRAVSADPEKEEESRVNSRRQVAASIGCQVEDLDVIVQMYPDWEERVLEERVKFGLDSVGMRDVSWDRLEAATMRKLLGLVETNRVTDAMELLAIAKAANVANRGRRGAQQKNGAGVVNQTNIGIGFQPGNPDQGVLPSGNLGTISLRLSHRTQQQISRTPGTSIEGEIVEERTLDSIEMLDLQAIQDAGKEES